MRKSRFTEEQIIKVLKEHAAGLSAGEVCRKPQPSGRSLIYFATITCSRSRFHQRSAEKPRNRCRALFIYSGLKCGRHF